MKTKQDRDLVQVGLKVTIEIHCETEREIIAHLQVIITEYKGHLKKMKGNIPDGIDLNWEDDNCYGSHSVTIEPDMA